MARINSETFVLLSSGKIYRQGDDGNISAYPNNQGFKNALGGRTIEITDANGETKQYPAANFWLNSRDRRECLGVQYCPNNVGLKHRHINIWRGWGGVQPCSGDCSVMLDHIHQIIADRNDVKANFLLDWLADILQN